MHNKKQRTLMIALTVLCLIGLPASYAFSRHSAYKIKQARIASEEKIRLQQEENDRIETLKKAEQEIEENKKIKLVAKTNYESHKEEVKIKEEKKKERVKKLKKEKINQDKEAKKLSTNTYSETTGTYVDLDKEFKEAGKKGKEIKKFSKKDEKKKQVQKLGNVKVKEISPEIKKPNKHKDDDLSWVAARVVTDEEAAEMGGFDSVEEYRETRKKADAGDKKARYKLYGSIEENTIVTDPNDHEKVPYEIE